MIFCQLLCSAIELALYTFVIDGTAVMSPASNTAIIGAMTVLLPTFLFCKLSENMTDRLLKIGDVFYKCPWYRLSVRQQKLFLLPIQRGQMEYRISGLGIVECSLAIFTAVRIYSFYVKVSDISG